jgi:hypothetical protein
MSLTRQRAIQAQPPEVGAEAWCEREAELLDRALRSARGLQAAPDWYDFVGVLFDRMDKWPDRKETVVRNTWRSERELTVDEFEWGIDSDTEIPESKQGMAAMFCDECGHLSSALHGFEGTAVCEDCWGDLAFNEQEPLTAFC